MFNKAVFPGKYIQGAGALAELPALFGAVGRKGLILASPSVNDKVIPASGIDWPARGVPIEVFRGECCEDELGRLAAAIAETHADVVVGMGGGKTIDAAKIAPDRAGLPVIVVPTIASTDAPTSGCAVIYSREGVFQSVCYQRMNPAAVLVDLTCDHRGGAYAIPRGRDGRRSVDLVRGQVLRADRLAERVRWPRRGGRLRPCQALLRDAAEPRRGGQTRQREPPRLKRSREHRKQSRITRPEAEQIVRRAYLGVLKREPDPSGSKTYADKVLAGLTSLKDLNKVTFVE